LPGGISERPHKRSGSESGAGDSLLQALGALVPAGSTPVGTNRAAKTDRKGAIARVLVCLNTDSQKRLPGNMPGKK